MAWCGWLFSPRSRSACNMHPHHSMSRDDTGETGVDVALVLSMIYFVFLIFVILPQKHSEVRVCFFSRSILQIFMRLLMIWYFCVLFERFDYISLCTVMPTKRSSINQTLLVSSSHAALMKTQVQSFQFEHVTSCMSVSGSDWDLSDTDVASGLTEGDVDDDFITSQSRFLKCERKRDELVTCLSFCIQLF